MKSIELDRRVRVAVSGIRQDCVDVVQERQEFPALNGQVLLVDHVSVRSIGMVGSLSNKSEWLWFDPEALHAQGERDGATKVEIEMCRSVYLGMTPEVPLCGGIADCWAWRDDALPATTLRVALSE